MRRKIAADITRLEAVKGFDWLTPWVIKSLRHMAAHVDADRATREQIARSVGRLITDDYEFMKLRVTEDIAELCDLFAATDEWNERDDNVAALH
jgi:hypothetical protein